MEDEKGRIAKIKASIAARAERSWRGEAPSQPILAGQSGGGCAAAIVVIVAVVAAVLFFRVGGPSLFWPTNATLPAAVDKNASFPTLAVGDEDWGYASEPAPSGSATIRTACIESAMLEGLRLDRGKLCVRSGEASGGSGDRVLVRLETPGPASCASRCVLAVRFDDGGAQDFTAVGVADGSGETLRLEDAGRFIAQARSSRKIRLDLGGGAAEGSTAGHSDGVTLAFRGAAPLAWD